MDRNEIKEQQKLVKALEIILDTIEYSALDIYDKNALRVHLLHILRNSKFGFVIPKLTIEAVDEFAEDVKKIIANYNDTKVITEVF